jgi:hypothetical protein
VYFSPITHTVSSKPAVNRKSTGDSHEVVFIS